MTLPIPFTAHAGEYLPGLIARAAADHSYSLSSHVLDPIGLGRNWKSVTNIEGIDAHRLAEHLGMATSELEVMLHPRVDAARHYFFGAVIRNLHREMQQRRVAPSSLRESPFVRAVWQIRAFGFDPKTKERLISSCPVCHRALGFQRTMGIAFCDWCERSDEYGFPRGAVDLRDFPQQVVVVNDEQALNFVTGLIDPDADVRGSFAPTLHDDLNLDRGALFEFATTLAAALVQDPSRSVTSVAKPGGREAFERLQPDVLARAGRILLDWPAGFHRACDESRSQADSRVGHYGVKKELGPLYALAVDRALDQRLRTAIRQAVDDNMRSTAHGLPTVRKGHYRNRDDLMTIHQASTTFGIRAKLFSRLAQDPKVTTIRSQSGSRSAPVLFKREEIEAIASARKDMEASSSAAIRIGVPRGAMAGLAAADLVEKVDGPVLHLVIGKEYYTRSSVDRLITGLAARITKGRPPANYVRLTKAVYRLPTGDKPWVRLIQYVLSGQLRVWEVKGRLDAILIRLAAHSYDEVAGVVGDGNVTLDPDAFLTQAEVGSILGVTEVSVNQMVRDGILRPSREGQNALRRKDVLALAERVMFTTELSRILGTSNRMVRGRMSELGVEPMHELERGKGLIWDRSEVMAALSRNDTATHAIGSSPPPI